MARRLLVVCLVVAYLGTRLYHLGWLPMVSDEGTYITWGVRALYARDLREWLASLEDGKQPLLAWLMPPLLASVPDRLLAGRLVSVCCGLATLGLLVVVGRRLYTPAVGWLAAGLYVVVPIALIHDRMALYDSLVTTTALLVLWATLAWAERPVWSRTVALGLAMGLALLTKLSALFFVALVPLVILLWRPRALRQWWPLAQAYFVAGAIYSVLYLSPIVDNIADGNFQRYSLTAGEVARLPWALWAQNVTFIFEAATSYLGWPLLALACVGMVWGLVRGQRSDVVVALWLGVPLVAFVLTAKLIYSRYVVFCFVVALLLAARALVAIWKLDRRGRLSAGRFTAGGSSPRLHVRSPLKGAPDGQGELQPASAGFVGLAGAFMPRRWQSGAFEVAGSGVGVLLGMAILVSTLPFDIKLLADPAAAPWMNDSRYITDRFQYVESNYAGYGLGQIVEYLRQQARVRPVVVMTRASTGMPRDGVTAYLLDWPGIHIAFAPERESIQDRLQHDPDAAYALAARGADVYYVLTDAPNGEQEQQFRRLNPGLVPLLEVPKPGGHSRFQLYETHLAGADATWLDPPARLGDRITLQGYRLSSRSARPGETVRLTIFWQATGRPVRDFTVFNHLEDPGGRIVGQKDGLAGGDGRPTSHWRAGDIVADSFDLDIKLDAAPGTYDLFTGMYELATQRRLPVRQDGEPDSDRVVLGRFTIVDG